MVSLKSLPPFRTGPSSIARYFFHDCDRFFRFNSTRSDLAAEHGVPLRKFDTSPVMQAVLETGHDWEEQVISKLADKVSVCTGPGKLHERRFSYAQTVSLLKTQPSGTYIYQGTLRPPLGFYKKFGLDPAVVRIGDNHPDLIQVLAGVGGRRLFRVMDLKRGASMRATYRIQVLLYALELDMVLRDNKIEADADLETGGVWLGGEDVPETCDLASVRPHLEAFLRHDLPRILTMPATAVDWHLYFRCEWCGYFDHCQHEMQKTNSISRLTGLTVNGKRHLVHEANVRTLPDLDQFLKRKDADEVLGRCASLAGRRRHLRLQVDAFAKGQPMISKASTPALPIWESVGVILTLQQEPLGKKIYLAGMLVQVNNEDLPRLFGESAEPELFKPRVWTAARNAPPDLASVQKLFVTALHDLFSRVHEFNQGKEWAEKVSVQCYVHSEHEKTLLVELLMQALLEPDLAPQAMTLLFHFQGPDLLLNDHHPGEAVQYPLVVLLGILGRLMALPVDVSYGLPESLKAMGGTFSYERKDSFHFPLGPGLKPDPIYLAWRSSEDENVDRISQQARMHLWAVQSLLTQLRQFAKGNLFAWPPKFSLPAATGITNTLLSRMAFFVRYESMLGCLGIREHRAEAREVLGLLGQLIELEADEPPMYRVVGDQLLDLDDGGFPKYLLIRDTAEGRKSQLEFPDYYYRGKPYGKQHEHRAVAGVLRVITDKLGFARQVELKAQLDGDEPRRGDRFLLYERFTDFNSEKVVTHLKQLDANGGGLFLEVIRDPVKASVLSPLPKSIEKTAGEEEKDLNLTPSQMLAYQKIRQRRLVAVWGPPGTGKTHFLASMILGLASAHARNGKPFRVLVTAFTHVSIENVLRKVATLQEKAKTKAAKMRIGKVRGWQSADSKPGDEIESGAVGAWLVENPHALVGSTVWGCLKEEVVFDVVIVDEASQVRVPESSIAISRVAEHGRLVLAGDHMQLPPIVTGKYPEPAEGEPVLHRSIFELILSRSGHADLLNPGTAKAAEDGPVSQLLENWRMNDVLTSFAAGLIYGPGYVPVNTEVKIRRLKLKPDPAASDLVVACLDPMYPLVILSLEGAAASKENAIEAGLVADLIEAMRERLMDNAGSTYMDDRSFFRDGVFVVSPHHVQIQLIRSELTKRRTWSAPPFVDTVDKMQGQETDAVVVSYGVSDTEFALMEAEFIYGLNRLNVAVTRARSKCIVCLPAPLLEGTPAVLDVPEAERGLAYMRSLVSGVEAGGELKVFDLGNGVRVRMMRTGAGWPDPKIAADRLRHDADRQRTDSHMLPISPIAQDASGRRRRQVVTVGA